MENNELRRIKRKDLLELLLKQANRIKELEEENKKLTKELENKKIKIEESGSIAEATIKLHEIFENAQKCADEYLDNVKAKCKKMETDMKRKQTKETKKNNTKVNIKNSPKPRKKTTWKKN